jgi:ApbE superfamily uncharacterized protein (UPF0280 family)
VNDIFTSEFHLKQTHMVLKCDTKEGIERAKQAVSASRMILESYIAQHPEFRHAMDCEKIDLMAPELVRSMMEAGQKAVVGPMASVAGALSEVATDAMILCKSHYAVAENGGDISLKGIKEVKIGIYAGKNEIAEKFGFMVKPDDLPMGICTSAGNVGHSISFGDADAVVVFSKSALLSDASATAIANVVKTNDPEGSIQRALEKAETIEGILGSIVFMGSHIGRTGRLPEMVNVVDYDF